MKMKEIKNCEVYGKALSYVRQSPHFNLLMDKDLLIDDVDLSKAFLWYNTDEGSSFWSKINEGEDLPLPNKSIKEELNIEKSLEDIVEVLLSKCDSMNLRATITFNKKHYEKHMKTLSRHKR